MSRFATDPSRKDQVEVALAVVDECLGDLSLLDACPALLDQVLNKNGNPLHRDSTTDNRLRYV
jgi:hypothetical protein